MSETSIYAPKWIAPCVADLVAQANFAIKLLQEGKLPAGAMSRAFSIVLEKHAPKDVPAPLTPPREPVASKKEMVVAPPIVAIPAPVAPQPVEEVAPGNPENITLKNVDVVEAFRQVVASRKIRIKELANHFELSDEATRAIIADETSGLKISGPGWVQLVEA